MMLKIFRLMLCNCNGHMELCINWPFEVCKQFNLGTALSTV